MNFTSARRNMVDSQVRPNGITDSRIIDAMMVVPRENFVIGSQQAFAYMDASIAVESRASSRLLLSPMALASLLQAAEIRPDDKVLMVGAATGYGAAVVAKIAKHVVALECEEALLKQARINLEREASVTVVAGDLAAGHAAQSPYDVIVIEGRAEQVPDHLLRQLAEGGRLTAVIGGEKASAIKTATMRDGVISWSRGGNCPGPLLPQFLMASPEFVF